MRSCREENDGRIGGQRGDARKQDEGGLESASAWHISVSKGFSTLVSGASTGWYCFSVLALSPRV